MLFGWALWLTPAFARPGGVAGFFLYRLLRFLMHGGVAASLSATGLPSLAALLVWRYAAVYPRFFFVVMPFLSFALFAHSVGLTPDLWFAAYWLLLPAVYVFGSFSPSKPVLKALAASLTAHMVGTLITLLFAAPAAWASLAPLVAFERLAAIAGMLVMQSACLYVASWRLDKQSFFSAKGLYA